MCWLQKPHSRLWRFKNSFTRSKAILWLRQPITNKLTLNNKETFLKQKHDKNAYFETAKYFTNKFKNIDGTYPPWQPTRHLINRSLLNPRSLQAKRIRTSKFIIPTTNLIIIIRWPKWTRWTSSLTKTTKTTKKETKEKDKKQRINYEWIRSINLSIVGGRGDVGKGV